MTKVSTRALDTKEKLVVNHKRSTILALALAVPTALVMLTSPVSAEAVGGLVPVPAVIPRPVNCPAPPALPDGAAAIPNYPAPCPQPPRRPPAPPPPPPTSPHPVGPGCPNCWG